MAFVAEIGSDIVGRRPLRPDGGRPDGGRGGLRGRGRPPGRGIGQPAAAHLTNYARNNGVDGVPGLRAARQLPDDAGVPRLRLPHEARDGRRRLHRRVPRRDDRRGARPWSPAHEQQAVAASLLPIFYPRSVAVIGASRDQRSIGGRVMRNVHRRPLHRGGVPGEPERPGGRLGEGLPVGARHPRPHRPGGHRGARPSS